MFNNADNIQIIFENSFKKFFFCIQVVLYIFIIF